MWRWSAHRRHQAEKEQPNAGHIALAQWDKEVTVTTQNIDNLHENLAFAKDTTDPRADLMLGILGSFAEFERAIIRERQAEGIALAKKAGNPIFKKPVNPAGSIE